MSIHFINPLDTTKTVCDKIRTKPSATYDPRRGLPNPYEPCVDYDLQPAERKTVTCTNCLRGVAFMYANLRGQVKRVPVEETVDLEDASGSAFGGICARCKRVMKALHYDPDLCNECFEKPAHDRRLACRRRSRLVVATTLRCRTRAKILKFPGAT